MVQDLLILELMLKKVGSAVQKLLARTGVTPDEIGVVEINGVFSSQSLACVKELGLEKGLPFEKANLWAELWR